MSVVRALSFFSTHRPMTRFGRVEPMSEYDFWLSQELARRRAAKAEAEANTKSPKTGPIPTLDGEQPAIGDSSSAATIPELHAAPALSPLRPGEPTLSRGGVKNRWWRA